MTGVFIRSCFPKEIQQCNHGNNQGPQITVDIAGYIKNSIDHRMPHELTVNSFTWTIYPIYPYKSLIKNNEHETF